MSMDLTTDNYLPGYKEGVRKLNEWYNAKLIWQDFPLYKEGDTTEGKVWKLLR